VEGWCNDGATECYHNPNAFDRAAATTGSCAEGGARTASSLNDRPWAAYANGTLLLSNNNGNGQVQIGVLQVPPALPADVRPATWNMCANPGASGSIPGVVSMRPDLAFIVPQFDGTKTVNVVLGNAHDIAVTSVVKAFEVTSHSANFGSGAYFGVSAADRAGNFYVAFENNTAKDGAFVVGLSTDGGRTFQPTTFTTTSKVAFLYVSGSQEGTGALVSWMQDSPTAGAADIYAAHLRPGADGLAITDVSRVASAVKVPCGDVMGSAPGPDGRAYVVVFADPAGCTDTPGSHPLSVYVQDKGGATV
jgi:hypothetical protein